KRKENQVFLLDLEYAGAFTIGSEVPEEYLRPILMIECPRILFPFARHIVATTTQEAGFPSLLLTPVDFAELYQQQVAQEQKETSSKSKQPEVLQ
ncbi:MAG: protein-export chaperone SecB, partial [Alphaproteobacteria bacterium]|nr:protein-export chaperone SecB [Alphaproteobacteria bacterium]